jgi:TPR repeat protein
MAGRAMGACRARTGTECARQAASPLDPYPRQPASRPARVRAGLCLAALLLLALCSQHVGAEEAAPKLRGDAGADAATDEATPGGDGSKAPPLRAEDGDAAVGGRGRDSTCAVPDEDKPKLRGDDTAQSAETRAANEEKAKAARDKAKAAAAEKAKAAAEKAAAYARPPNGSLVIAESADFVDHAAGKLLGVIERALSGGEQHCRALQDSVLDFLGGQWANSLMLCRVHEFANGTSVRVPYAVQNQTELFGIIYENATLRQDPECQFWLGRMFEEGCFLGDETCDEIVTKDVNQAAQLYMAAGPQVPAANRALGVLLQAHGDAESAASLYTKALEQGDVRALALLGNLYEAHGQISEAADLYEQGCKAEEPLAMTCMALMLQQGAGVAQDSKKAIALLVRAAARLECSAFFLLGSALEKGEGLGKDVRAAAGLYEIAANLGHVGAAAELARLHKTGIGVEADADKALHWARVADEGGMVWAEEVAVSEAKSEYARLKAPLVGGRPSRYHYVPISAHPLSEEDKSAQNRQGFTGMDPTPRLGETARYAYMQADDYFKLPGVLGGGDAAAASAA